MAAVHSRAVDLALHVKAEGDTLFAIRKTIWVNVVVRNTASFFEAGTYTGRNGTIFTFHVGSYQLGITYSSWLRLNEGRSQKFKEEISARVKKELMSIFNFEYKDLLSRAVESVRFPRDSWQLAPRL
ncbi:hypothetical protein HPB49_018161 [Dermacentor silvarum]|uniref:Uncharacterized protein n=1 Tax=Dermacentor silvarum TaxID=543639 RepID=A0ACB8DEY2_DERSI|nr:hypothetical protein HPB49_018161 [Dermacentor silvarum]